ncbi:hypothetical protein AAKU67_001787 [Oxalobacteraceae bacterium GrIS 2.11]
MPALFGDIYLRHGRKDRPALLVRGFASGTKFADLPGFT